MNNIKKLRKERNMTRKELALLVNMSVSALGRRERGEVPPTADELRKFAEVFQCKYEDILEEN